MDSCHKGFDANGFYVFPNFISSFIFRTFSLAINILKYGRKTSFMSHIRSITVFILYKAVCFFVYSIIREMHA